MNRLRNTLSRLCLRARRIRTVDRAACKLFQLWFDLPENPFDASPARWIDAVFLKTHAMPFPPLHYYSPLPDAADLKARLSRWYRPSDSIGMSWDIPKQVSLLSRLAKYVPELDALPSFDEVSAAGYGPGYGEVEARLLYLMLRHFKPARLIEVGSGVSTVFAVKALDASCEPHSVRGRITCVDPHPSEKLRELCGQAQLELAASQVQDVPLSRFQELGEDDVLFIDSSHVSKKDGDVDYLLLEVIPRLARGVVIHFHDISLPLPALPLDHPLFDDSLFWNESAIVKAFLLFNSAFEPLLCESLLHVKAPEALKRIVPMYDPAVHFPSSLWLRRER